MKLGPHIHVKFIHSFRMNSNNFGDPLTFISSRMNHSVHVLVSIFIKNVLYGKRKVSQYIVQYVIIRVLNSEIWIFVSTTKIQNRLGS